MKIIVYIVIIVLLVGCAFAGVKALKQSSLFQSVANAVDTVKDFVDSTGDGSNGSSSQSGEGDNQSGTINGGNSSGNGNQDGSTTPQEFEVTEIGDASLCGLFTIKKSGTNTARAIVVGDVFENGDTICCNQSTYSDYALLEMLMSVDYFIFYRSTSNYVYWGAYLFGNSLVDVRKVVSAQDSSIAVYYIYIGDQIVWQWNGMSLGWVYDSILLSFDGDSTEAGNSSSGASDNTSSGNSGGGGGVGHVGGR